MAPVFAPYRDAFADVGNLVVGIGGNHDYYGGELGLENSWFSFSIAGPCFATPPIEPSC